MKASSRSNVQAPLPPMGLTSVDQRQPSRSTSVDQDLAILRKCVADLGYTLDSLEAATGKGRAYIGKVLNGDKPMPHEFEIALPDDLEAEYRKRQAEHWGAIVVAPVSEDVAVKHLVSGLCGLLRKRGAA